MKNEAVTAIYSSPFKVVTESNEYEADVVVVATGGLSYPLTGSTGDGYKFAKRFSHTVTKTSPSLVALKSDNDECADMAGLALKNISIKVTDINQKIVYTDFGEMLFTRRGISGPIALSTSSVINKFDVNQIALYLDLKPGLKLEQGQQPNLDERILKDFKEFTNKEYKNSLVKLFPDRLAQYVVAQSKISPDKQVNRGSAEERERLRNVIKALEFNPSRHGDLVSSIVTSGGIDVKQVNPSTMQSKINPNVYFAGETLDVDAYTGGFNMQIAFSTGYLAGVSASKEW